MKRVSLDLHTNTLKYFIWHSGDFCERFGSEQLRSSLTGAAVILDWVLTVRRPGPMKAVQWEHLCSSECLRSSRWLIQWKKSHHASVTHMSTWNHQQQELCCNQTMGLLIVFFTCGRYSILLLLLINTYNNNIDCVSQW